MSQTITFLVSLVLLSFCTVVPIHTWAQGTTNPSGDNNKNRTTYFISSDPTPDNPRDILTGTPQDLTNLYTRVGDDGRVMSTVISSCPKLMVDVNLPFIQSCVSSTAILAYCNHGGAVAYDTYVEIILDSHLQLDSASLAYTILGPQHVRFNTGTIPVGLCGNIDLHLTTTCDPHLLGVKHCIDAHIFPDTLCSAVQNVPLLDVDGECLGNALKFKVTNHGTPLSTQQQVQYIIIDDHLIVNGQRVVLQQGTLQIPSQGVFSTIVPITQTAHRNYKMEIRDAQNTIMAICFIELCTSNPQIIPVVSDFYTATFWNGSHLPFVDQGCAINGKTLVDANVGSTTISALNDNNTPASSINTIDDAHLTTAVQVQIAPNPVQQHALIILDGADDVVYQFELYALTGQLVRTLAIRGNSTTDLERMGLPSGFYVYRISAKGMPLQEGKILMQ
ncbi:MAG: T9SS type A sorting domain-containing protein [Aureispira sp.]